MKFAKTRGGIDDHAAWCGGKRQNKQQQQERQQNTKNRHVFQKQSYLKTEAGLFFAPGDGRQLQEITADNQLDASKRLGRPPHRPRFFTEINRLKLSCN